MRLFAALGACVFVYLAVGLVVDVRPTRMPRRHVGGLRSEWQVWLNQSGADVNVVQMASLSVACGLLGGVTGYGLTGVAPLAMLAGAGSGLFPFFTLSRRRLGLIANRRSAWVDGLRDLVTHLRTGVSIHVGLSQLGETGPIPLRPYFDRYRGLAGALDQRAALEVVREELADPFSDRILEIMLVAFDQGPSIVLDVLGQLAVASAEDLRLVAEIETAQLETRLEARGAAVLPFLVLALLCATSGDYRAFYQSSTGWLVIAFGGILSIAGLVIIARLGRVPTEDRILAGGSS
jgi:tight adherence protein B